MQQLPAIFGQNYDVGWVGFSFDDDSFISKGIAYFTREEICAFDGVKISHTFIVEAENRVIEATTPRVQESTLLDRFADPTLHIFFRQPLGWNQGLGLRIVESAREHLGERYDYTLIAAEALANSFAGRLLNRWFKNRPNRWVSRLLDGKRRKICSELVAHSLNDQPELKGRGVLAWPENTINPVALALSTTIWEPDQA